MNLFEHEGKALLARHGLRVPRSFLVRRGARASADDVRAAGAGPLMVKAQVLSKDRAGRGGVLRRDDAEAALDAAQAFLASGLDSDAVEAVLIEEAVSAVREAFLSCVHDSGLRGPALLFAPDGGTGVEASRAVRRFALDARDPTAMPAECREALETVSPSLVPSVRALIEAFWTEDARQAEINPVAILDDGSCVALDAKITLDAAAAFRHPEWQAYGGLARSATSPREAAARAIDAGERGDRGTAGTYREMDGDAAVLLSGGGASLAVMDEMARAGLRPANYAEYSGNPPRERVRALARIVLSKPGLRGLLVAGGIANFTDVKETFAGIVEALEEARPTFPIVVRRAGPGDDEGLELMRECADRLGLRLALHGKETTLAEAVAGLKEMMDAHGNPA